MQIGVRWRAGHDPHPRVPRELATVCAQLDHEQPCEGSWTLTWLEGLPRCERSDGTRVLLLANHRVQTLAPHEGEFYDEDDDDWLGGA